MQQRLKVASATMEAAKSAMDAKEGMMLFLETGTKHLSLIVGLGKNVAEVRSPVMLTLYVS